MFFATILCEIGLVLQPLLAMGNPIFFVSDFSPNRQATIVSNANIQYKL